MSGGLAKIIIRRKHKFGVPSPRQPLEKPDRLFFFFAYQEKPSDGSTHVCAETKPKNK